MNAGALYDFTNDDIVIEKIKQIRESFSYKDSTHESRLLLLAPMMIQCSDTMTTVVRATIYESEQRQYYTTMKKLKS